jgi:hypothetical protein
MDCTFIGQSYAGMPWRRLTPTARRLDDFPEMVEHHNKAVEALELHLVKYLQNGSAGQQRPVMRIGGWLGMGGKKVDAIDHLSKEIRALRAKIDYKRQAVSLMLRDEGTARRDGNVVHLTEGENYGMSAWLNHLAPC